MTILSYVIFGLSILGFIFVLLNIIFIAKEKRFENEKLEQGLNTIIFGLFFLMLLITINVLKYGDEIFHKYFIKVLPAVTIYINYLIQITNLIFIPLIAICFLIAMVFFRKLV